MYQNMFNWIYYPILLTMIYYCVQIYVELTFNVCNHYFKHYNSVQIIYICNLFFFFFNKLFYTYIKLIRFFLCHLILFMRITFDLNSISLYSSFIINFNWPTNFLCIFTCLKLIVEIFLIIHQFDYLNYSFLNFMTFSSSIFSTSICVIIFSYQYYFLYI